MYCVSEVLVHTQVRPPNAHCIGIRRSKRLTTLSGGNRPLVPFLVQCDRCYTQSRPFMPLWFPPTHVMATRGNTGSDAFCNPRLENKVTQFRHDSHEITCLGHPHSIGIYRMDPERVRVSNLVEPFRVRAPGVNLHGHSECRDQRHLISLKILGVNMALYVRGYCKFGPTPVMQCP